MSGARPDRSRLDAHRARPDVPAEVPALVPLNRPRDGVPDVVVDGAPCSGRPRPSRAGSGPVAIDAERASGYRYGQRAYLVQLRREGCGHLAHRPVAVPDLSPVGEAIGDAEWVLHAATQDLPCLAEVGLRPQVRSSTPSSAAGWPGCRGSGSAPWSSTTSGCSLAKEHSAVDWSARPLPEPWLLYAALDVEVLVDLRDAVAADLESQGKSALGGRGVRAPAVDSPGRSRGSTRGDAPPGCTGCAALARTRHRARAVGDARDEIGPAAGHRPGPGAARRGHREIAMTYQKATAAPRSVGSSEPRLARTIKRNADAIIAAIDTVLRLPEDALPPVTLPPSGPPPAKAWADRDPVAADRLARSRELLGAISRELVIPVENILTPDLLRRYLWEGPDVASTEDVTTALLDLGARHWQTRLAAPLIARAIAERGPRPPSVE